MNKRDGSANGHFLQQKDYNAYFLHKSDENILTFYYKSYL